jgi:hypothetical protein
LGIKHTRKNTFFNAMLWMIGSASIGFLGVCGGLLKPNSQTVLTISLVWPVIFTTWVKNLNRKEIEPADESVVESEDLR